jgi:nitroimidazol reductase NimA-like FMN-containing flavoprotein (pyridoxamine 5'-phosphate oxidase superfamily)
MLDPAQNEKLVALMAREHLAVIVTQGDEWPTATMQAFARTPAGDLAFIMLDGSVKFKNLLKRPNVTVLIDSRHSSPGSSFEIVRAAIDGIAREVPLDSDEWNSLKPAFLKRNPFEAPLFNFPVLRMVLVKPARVSYAGAGRDRFKADF